MNISADIQLADFRMMLADHGEPITWNTPTTNALTAIVDLGPQHRVPHTHGPEPLVDLIVDVLIADLPNGWNPQTHRIGYAGGTYRPVNTHRDEHVVTFECQRI